MNRDATSLNELTRFKEDDCAGFLCEVETITLSNGTKATLRTYLLHWHAGSPRTKDLARKMAQVVTDYATPRTALTDAHRAMAERGSAEKLTKLSDEARALFVDRDSGEGGEVLLYYLAESVLQLPQLMCKMPHKTNTKMHIHGVDGIHGRIGPAGRLELYWGESKLHASASTATDECLATLAHFLLNTGGIKAPLERDLQLLTTNLDLDNESIQESVLQYLDREAPRFLSVDYCGLGLIGFDVAQYPNATDVQALHAFAQDAKNGLAKWKEKIATAIGEHKLNEVVLELFCVPFDSVETFRLEFLRAIGVTLPVSPPVDDGNVKSKVAKGGKTSSRKKDSRK